MRTAFDLDLASTLKTPPAKRAQIDAYQRRLRARGRAAKVACRAEAWGPCQGPLGFDHKFNDGPLYRIRNRQPLKELRDALIHPERFQTLCIHHNKTKHKLPWLTWMVEDGLAPIL